MTSPEQSPNSDKENKHWLVLGIVGVALIGMGMSLNMLGEAKRRFIQESNATATAQVAPPATETPTPTLTLTPTPTDWEVASLSTPPAKQTSS